MAERVGGPNRLGKIMMDYRDSIMILLQLCNWPLCMQPRLQGMLPIVNGSFAALQKSAVQWPNSVKQCASVCNSLNLVNKLKVVGDVADYEAFKACEARFLVSFLYPPLSVHVLQRKHG